MSLARSRALGLSALNLGSKLLAVAKTVLVAALFGAGATLDAFWVAYSLPMLLPGLLTSVITVAFVPRFVRNLEGRTGPEAWRGANTLFSVVLALSVLAALLMSVWASALVGTLAPGLAPDTHAQAVSLTRMLLPCIPLLTFCSLLSALSNARERFYLPALEGVLTNVAILLLAALLVRQIGIGALVLGVIAGFVLLAAVMAWGNRDLLRSSLRPALALRHPDFVQPLAHLLPLFIGAAGSVFTGLVNQYFLSHGGEGAISAMAYAVMFAFLPVEVFGQAVMTTFYPTLGRAFAQGDFAAASAAFLEGSRFLLFLTLPCAVLLAIFAEPFIVLLLERGRFDAGDSALTAQLIALLGAGLVFRAAAYFNYRVLHAAQRPWLQVTIGLAGVATHIGLCLLWTPRYGGAGVALATSLSLLQSALLSLLAAGWCLRLRPRRGLAGEFGQLLLLTALLVALGLCVRHGLGPLPEDGGDGARQLASIWQLLGGAGAGILTLLIAGLLKQPDLMQLAQMLRAKRAPSA